MKLSLNSIKLFFLNPASARPLAFLRMGLALLLLVQAWMLRTSVQDFLASDGLIQGDLVHYLSSPYTPQISTWIAWLSPLHFSEEFWIHFIAGTYVICLFLFGLGLYYRVAAVGSWFLHWTLTNTAQTTSYGLDLYAHVFLFYLMWMPAADTLSLDALRKNRDPNSSYAGLSLRVLQLHLCISYLTSGIEKAQGIQWWNGELLWRALNLPVYQQFDLSWLVNWPSLLKLGCWVTLALEIGYCAFIWPKLTRKFWIAGMMGLHLGIAIFLGLHLFGIMMCLLTLTVFGVSSQPTRSSRPAFDCYQNTIPIY